MKRSFIILFLSSILACKSGSLFSQKISIGHLYLSDTSRKNIKISKKYAEDLQESHSEFDLAANSLFVFYKEFLSSQDGKNCSFTPSCSQYAVRAIKKRGLVKGAIMSFDRYTRCNSLSREYYEADYERQLLIDPVP